VSATRRAVLSVGLLAGALMGLYPPWLETKTQIPGPDAAHLHPVATTSAWGYAPLSPPSQAGCSAEDAAYMVPPPQPQPDTLPASVSVRTGRGWRSVWARETNGSEAGARRERGGSEAGARLVKG
jgi:hypothetical protein